MPSAFAPGLAGRRWQQTREVKSNLRPALRRAVADGARGVAATAVMTVPMALRWRAQPNLPPGPMVITERIERLLGVAPDEHPPALRHPVWLAAHASFGAGVGAVFGVLAGRRASSGTVLAYGAAVWAANYALLLPALSLYPSPRRDDRLRAAETFASHLVWAGALRGLRRLADGD